MNRRQLLAILAASRAVPTFAANDENYLLITQSEIEAVKQKAQRAPWAKASLDKLMASAESALAEPVQIPDRGGQWGHWYVCKKDGVTLQADSPTRHRCPKCGEIYTGEPYDSVYLTRIHAQNSRLMRDFGLAYRFTGREEFARKSAELLAGYAAKYTTYPRRDNLGKDSVNGARVLSQTLDESTWVIPAVWGYAMVRSAMSARERRTVEFGLFLPAMDIIVGRSYARLPNIQCWKDTAIALTGFALGNNDLVLEALDHPVRGFRTLMKRQVYPGGWWSEGSFGYQHYALSALWPLAEAARRQGIDFYADSNYRSLFDGPLELALPDGTSAGFNDNPGESVEAMADLYEVAFARWEKPEYGKVAATGKRESLQALLYGAETLPTGPYVHTKSVLLREAGIAALRSPEATVVTRFGTHGGGHGHPDKLNIVTYGAGQLFGTDPGSIAYGSPLHGEWYRSTVAHNTVVVDESRQANVDGELIDWREDGAATVLEASAGAVYSGVTLKRSLRLNGGVLEDSMQCVSSSEHVYDWCFHAPGKLTLSVPTETGPAQVSASNGYQHIHNVRQAKVDGEWTARWESGGATLTLRVAAVPGTIVYTGEGPGQVAGEFIPMIVIRRRAKQTAFAVTHTFAKT
jgi:hypothetical protein